MGAESMSAPHVTPAQAVVSLFPSARVPHEIPACAGMTEFML